MVVLNGGSNFFKQEILPDLAAFPIVLIQKHVDLNLPILKKHMNLGQGLFFFLTSETKHLSLEKDFVIANHTSF